MYRIESVEHEVIKNIYHNIEYKMWNVKYKNRKIKTRLINCIM